VYHCDGETWTTYNVDLSTWGTPNLLEVTGFHYISDDEIYAIVCPNNAPSTYKIQIIKWDGSSWSRVAQNNQSGYIPADPWGLAGTEGVNEFLFHGGWYFGQSVPPCSKWTGSGVSNESAGKGFPINVWMRGSGRDGDGNYYVLNDASDETNNLRLRKGNIGGWSIYKSESGRAASAANEYGAYNMIVRGAESTGDLEILYTEGVTATTDVNIVHLRGGTWYTTKIWDTITAAGPIAATEEKAGTWASTTQSAYIYDLETRDVNEVRGPGTAEVGPSALMFPCATFNEAPPDPPTGFLRYRQSFDENRRSGPRQQDGSLQSDLMMKPGVDGITTFDGGHLDS
jgi:hypothetical protein